MPDKQNILLVDDEKLIRWSIKEILSTPKYTIFESEDIFGAAKILDSHKIDAIFLDIMMPGGSGLDFLEKHQKALEGVPVIMLTALDQSKPAVTAMKLGAFEYITKPFVKADIMDVLKKALDGYQAKKRVMGSIKPNNKGVASIIGASPSMNNMFAMLEKIAESKSTTVLITGETGTGKELVATAIHTLSNRAEHPLKTVNCAAIHETLIESELFGHEKGAFTDAKEKKIGIFEAANKGTVFLDEIGDISPGLQAKLLRVIEQKYFSRVGGSKDITVDVRIVSATNVNLEACMAAGTFRADLYYRLNVAQINIPPLNERGNDIVLLAQKFLEEFNVTFEKSFKGFSSAAISLLKVHPWPGNVRELRNVIERTVLFNDGDIIEVDHIQLQNGPSLFETRNPAEQPSINEAPDQSLDSLEKNALLAALEEAQGNKSKAARILKISRDTMRYRLKKHNLE